VNHGIRGPTMLIWRRPFGTDRYGRRQGQRFKHRIIDVAPHIPKCAGAEIQALAPVARMIPLLADERPLGADTQPKIPVKPGRDPVAPPPASGLNRPTSCCSRCGLL